MKIIYTNALLLTIRKTYSQDVEKVSDPVEWINPAMDNNNMEWERDLITSGQKKAFIIVSDNRLEEFGMDNCASWQRTFVPEVPIRAISSCDPFLRTVS